MSDLERVRAWFTDGALLHPLDGALNTVDLMRALAHACGAAQVELSAPAHALANRIDPAAPLVCVLVDGLGMPLLEQLDAGDFLRRHLDQEMRSVFPSTTAAALTSIATLCHPARHAVYGWHTHLPAAGVTATVLPFVARTTGAPLETLGIDVASVFPEPSRAPQIARPALHVIPATYVDSTFSRYARGGAPGAGYRDVDEALDLVVRHAHAQPATYTYLYVADLDVISHRAGPDSRAARTVLRGIERALETLRARLPRAARLVISADHGHLDVPADAVHVLEPHDALLELLVVPPHGEARVPCFTARPGRATEFADQFRARFGARFALLTIDEVDALRLLGPEPLAAITRARLGDSLALAAGMDVLEVASGPSWLPLRGYHGGLQPAEVRIPLLLA